MFMLVFLYNIKTFIRFTLHPLDSPNILQDFICFPCVTYNLFSLVSSSNLKQCSTLPQLPYCLLVFDRLLCDVVCFCLALAFYIDLQLFCWWTYCRDDDMDVLVLCVWFEVKPVSPLSFSWSTCIALLVQLKHVVYPVVINHASIKTNFFKSSGCFIFELLTFVNFVLLTFSYRQMYATFKP